MSVNLDKLQPPSFYLNNLIILRKHIAARPVLRLEVYTTHPATAQAMGHPCQTLHCLVGEIPTIPHFIEMGVIATDIGAPSFPDLFCVDVGVTLLRLFGQPEGCDAWYALAERSSRGTWDDSFPWASMTDKELALARLDRAIKYYTDSGE